MYLFELKDLPKRADKAVLEWDTGVRTPSRNRNRIGLPRSTSVQYFPLREGNQFLVVAPNTAGSNQVWFGGTDEEPFLVELESKVAGSYVHSEGNEEQFYGSLVPETINRLSDETRIGYRRQGDIFAAQFCADSSFERRVAHLFDCDVHKGELPVLSTRHMGKGTWITVKNRNSTQYLFRGKLEAPDHKTVSLEDGLYMFGQTRHIVHPTQAD